MLEKLRLKQLFFSLPYLSRIWKLLRSIYSYMHRNMIIWILLVTGHNWKLAYYHGLIGMPGLKETFIDLGMTRQLQEMDIDFGSQQSLLGKPSGAFLIGSQQSFRRGTGFFLENAGNLRYVESLKGGSNPNRKVVKGRLDIECAVWPLGLRRLLRV